MKTPYVTIALLWLGHFLVDYMIGVWAVYKTLVGLDIAIAGLIAATAAFAGEGMQLVFGSLSDRGYRKMLIIGGVVTTCASALMSYTQEYAFLFLLFTLTCMGSGAFHPSAAGLVGKLAKNRKGLFMTIFQSGGALGLACSQLIFVFLYQYLSGNTIILAIPSLCLVALIAFIGLSETPGPHVLPGRGIDLKVFLRFFQNRDLRNLYIIQLCNQALFWGVIFMLPDLLIYREYPESISLGGGHLFFILGGAMMIIPGGWLADKISHKRVIFAAQVLSILILYLFLANPFIPASFLCALLFLLGATLGVVAPVVVAMGSELVPSRPGMVSAFLMGLVWCVAEGVGQGGGGLLTKLFTENETARALATLGMLPVFSLLAVRLLPLEISEEEQWEVRV